jgi:hypothetical protein
MVKLPMVKLRERQRTTEDKNPSAFLVSSNHANDKTDK